MTENISLEKAIHKMKTGDKFKTKSTAYMDMVMVENGTLKGVSIDDKVEMSSANLGIMGHIIPAKKEMVSWQDYWNKEESEDSKIYIEVDNDNAATIWNNSAKNRDILYADLEAAAHKFIGKVDRGEARSKVTYSELSAALDKIILHKRATSSTD